MQPPAPHFRRNVSYFSTEPKLAAWLCVCLCPRFYLPVTVSVSALRTCSPHSDHSHLLHLSSFSVHSSSTTTAQGHIACPSSLAPTRLTNKTTVRHQQHTMTRLLNVVIAVATLTVAHGISPAGGKLCAYFFARRGLASTCYWCCGFVCGVCYNV